MSNKSRSDGARTRLASHRQRPPVPRGHALRTAYADLRRRPNVLGAFIGHKHRRGKPTGATAIVTLVSEKPPPRRLAPHERIPRRVQWPTTSRTAGTIATDVEVASPFVCAGPTCGPGDRVQVPHLGTIGVALEHPLLGQVVTTAGHVVMPPGWSGIHEWDPQSAPRVQVQNVGGSPGVMNGRLYRVAITDTQDYALIRPDAAICRNAYLDQLALGEAYQPDDDDLGGALLVLNRSTATPTTLAGYDGDVPIQDHPPVRHAILTKRCTLGGDSGSVLVDENRRVWGLLVGFNGDHSVFMSIYELLGNERATLL